MDSTKLCKHFKQWYNLIVTAVYMCRPSTLLLSTVLDGRHMQGKILFGWFMVFNATFNNISVIS